MLLVFHHMKLVTLYLCLIHRRQMGIRSPAIIWLWINSYLGQIPPLSSLLGRSAPLDTVGPSELLPGQSGAAPGPPRGAPISANMTGQFRFTTRQTGYTYVEPTVAHFSPNYYTPHQQYVSPPTYLNYSAPYDHRPINIIDQSWQEGRHSNA